MEWFAFTPFFTFDLAIVSRLLKQGKKTGSLDNKTTSFWGFRKSRRTSWWLHVHVKFKWIFYALSLLFVDGYRYSFEWNKSLIWDLCVYLKSSKIISNLPIYHAILYGFGSKINGAKDLLHFFFFFEKFIFILF